MGTPMPSNVERFTYADLLTWPADERWELIDGVAYKMAYDLSPTPSRHHQQIVTALSAQFYNYLEGKPCEVFSAPFDVRLPKPAEDGMSATTVVEPDVTVVCDPEKLDDRGCLGAPTLVVEVLSPDTATYDQREKFHTYERAGVPEYWIISPFGQNLQVFTLDATGHYGPPTVYGKDEEVPVGVLPGLVIQLGRVFAA